MMASELVDPPVPPHPTVLSGHRNIVLAIDTTEECEKILKWARKYHKEGDIFHITHVAKLLGHKDEVFHGPVGTSISFHEKTLNEAKKDIDVRKAWFRERVKVLADLQHVQCIPYLYVEDTSASTAVASKVIGDLANKVHADCIVAAKSNKTAWQKFTVGSTAGALLGTSHSVVLVAT